MTAMEPTSVRELIELLNKIENKDTPVFAMVNDSCKLVTSVEEYEDAVELWAR